MSYQKPAHIETILKNLPAKPGCYLLKNSRGKIIYVGKAKRLRNRVRSYFTAQADGNGKTLRMRSEVDDIDFIITENEVKALILEETLIKKHKPRYNIELKDDKRYPYIRVSWNNAFPKVETTRRVVNDGSRYFGPYSAMWVVQKTLSDLRRAFPYLTCDRDIDGKDERACLFHDIKLCNAPCIGAVSREQYRSMIQELMDVLSGRAKAVQLRLANEMKTAAKELNFEKAAALRDQLQAIDFITNKHKAVGKNLSDHDVIALAREDRDATVQIMFIRNGKLIGSDSRMMNNTEGESDAVVLEQFISQFYAGSGNIPRELILPDQVGEARILESWLSDKRASSKVTIHVPQRGDKRKLVRLAQENALESLQMMRAQYEADTTRHEQAMAELQAALSLPRIPNRIECYDISTTQGTAIVASRIVFVRGAPRKSEYRRFNIRSVAHSGADDYQSMQEALTRRFSRWKAASESTDDLAPDGVDKDETWRLLPDLLLIDGGKGQLNVASAVLDEFGLSHRVPVASLAKRLEEVFMPGRARSILLERQGEALYLLQRARDEAHRFAITSHRSRRRKMSLASRLETIPGVGPKRRKLLLKHFENSIDAIRSASIGELAQVNGINKEVALAIKSHLD
ncbi:MAG: excinuclease ABC subunit UvrC [Chloroflexi bacterium]|nr:excinuclease ABC subunit UvrC [Chloroflexota bacterium]MCY4246166.1 excinuclease ABC subunit UvrC [Chloroflexota bacterium]